MIAMHRVCRCSECEADGDAAELRAALDRYAFQSEVLEVWRRRRQTAARSQA